MGDQLAAGAVPLDVFLVGRDVYDTDGDWAQTSELPTNGAVLVRPDQHVAWRSTALSGNPSGALENVLRTVSGR